MKKCFKCGEEQPLSEFYKHKQMADGHLNKCKACTKSDVKKHREDNIEHFREYDKRRGNRQSPEYLKDYRKRYPNKVRAHRKVAYEVWAGNLSAKPCSNCGREDTHAHHSDYLKPLDIEWLCPVCHCQWHRDNGEGLNP